MTTVRDVSDYLKALAPLNLAEDWDNVGLLLGDDLSQVTRATSPPRRWLSAQNLS